MVAMKWRVLWWGLLGLCGFEISLRWVFLSKWPRVKAYSASLHRALLF